MKKELLEKVKETREKIQHATVEKINLGMVLHHYKRLDDSRKKYNDYRLNIKKTLKTLFSLFVEFVLVTSFSMSFLAPLPVFSKVCIGILAGLNVITIGILNSEIKKKNAAKQFLVDNGYNPKDEEQMSILDKKVNELSDEYNISSAYIEDLKKEEENLNYLVNSNMAGELNKYPDLLKEYLNKEFNEYLNDPKTMNPKNVDFEPNVLEEDLVWSNPHQLKLK